MLKKVLKQYFQNKKIVIISCAVLILVLSRFLWISKFPVSVNHDETDVILSAKSYWRFGTDLSGIAFPKSLVSTKTDAGLSGLPSLILSPIVGPLNISLLNARIAFVIINLLTIFFLSLIIWESTRKAKLVLIIVFVSLLNPWLYIYGRFPTEAPFALLFSLVGIYLAIKYKDNRLIYSLPFFVGAFFSYQGAKPVIPFLVLGIILIHKKFLKGVKNMFYFIYLSLFGLALGVYLYTSYGFGSTLSQRADELIFLNLAKYSVQVDEQRRASLEFPYREVFYNKLTYALGQSFEKYFGVLSPSFLFFRGDMMVPFQEHGVLYSIDLIFIIVGIFFLGRLRQKKGDYFISIIVLLALVGPASSALSVVGNQYIFRSFLYIPLFIVLISIGIFYFLNYVKWNIFGILIISSAYLIYFIGFLTFFFFRYSVKEQENQFLGERVLANYLVRVSNLEKRVYVVTDYPYRVFYEYVFFSDYLDRVTVLPPVETNEFSDRHIKIVGDCSEVGKGIILVQQGIWCPQLEDLESSVIENQKDSGTIFKVYNDALCGEDNLAPYRRKHLISDYSIEKMDNNTFCNRWINKYER